MQEKRQLRTIKRCNTDEIDVNKLNSCLAPVVKTFKAPDRMVKTIWGLFCAIMTITLTCFIVLVLNKYLSYVTITRIEYLSSPESYTIPAITICFGSHRLGNIRKQMKGDISKFKNSIEPEHLKCNNATWNSRLHGKSLVYQYGGNFSVELMTHPYVDTRLSVYEQVFGMPDKICNTFQMSLCEESSSNFWKILFIKVNSEEDYEMTIHEEGTYPFDNIGNNIYDIYSKFDYYLFFSKSILNRLKTPRSPCEDKRIELNNINYRYSHGLCNANLTCEEAHKQKKICPLDIAERLKDPKVFTIDNHEECLSPCETSTFTVNNMIKVPNPNQSAIFIVRGEGVQEKTEEKIFTLAKLFSEIGGLGSFFIGFSIIVLFEIFELGYFFRKKMVKKKKMKNNEYVKEIQIELNRNKPVLRCINEHMNGTESPIAMRKLNYQCNHNEVDEKDLLSSITVRVEFDNEVFYAPCQIII